MSRTVQIYAHRSDAEFAARLAVALEAQRFALRTGPFEPEAVAAVIGVWSPASIASPSLRAAALAPFELGKFAAVSLDGAGPPQGFEAVEPVDLTGWTDDIADPRWADLVAAIERAGADADETRPAAGRRGLRLVPLVGFAALAALLIVAAFLLLAPNPESRRAEAPAASREPPMLGALESLEARPEDRQPETPPADERPAEPAAEPPAAASENMAEEEDPLGTLIARALSDDPQADEEAAPEATGLFRDCDACPLMARIPAGEGLVGAPEGEASRQRAETPPRRVRIAQPFALGVYEVTFAEWEACVGDGGCRGHSPSDAGWGRGARPVINVSWSDARAYADWLSARTGARYRLPSEAEWEYAARAGTETPFSFGTQVTARLANFDAAHPYGGGGAPARGRGRTLPVGGFAANAFGLHDMHGNVWEWVADCWAATHDRPPADAAPREGRCAQRVVKGGAWSAGGWRLRAAHRLGRPAGAREAHTGFRVARELD